MEPNNEGTVATVPQSDDLVKLGKRKAWAKFLAYEVSAHVNNVYLHFACKLLSMMIRTSFGWMPFSKANIWKGLKHVLCEQKLSSVYTV